MRGYAPACGMARGRGVRPCTCGCMRVSHVACGMRECMRGHARARAGADAAAHNALGFCFLLLRLARGLRLGGHGEPERARVPLEHGEADLRVQLLGGRRKQVREEH